MGCTQPKPPKTSVIKEKTKPEKTPEIIHEHPPSEIKKLSSNEYN